MKLTRDNVLWFAGLFEGEGYFRFQPKGRKSMGIAIKMTDRDVLERALDYFGGGIWDGRKKAAAHHKQAYQWSLDKRDKAYALLAAIYPFLGARRKAQVEKWITEYKQCGVVGATRFKAQPLKHGVRYGYVRGCRCASCTAANTASCKKYRQASTSTRTVH